MLRRIRKSIALKLILASAIPSALVLLLGLGALIAHTERIAAIDPGAAFRQLKEGAVLGSLLTLTFAALAVALTTRRFLLKPIHRIASTMARAELGDFLVRAQVATEDELGRLSRSFNTMLARVTDMAVKEIETRRSMEQLERELAWKRELQIAHEKLAEHARDMELLLGVLSAVTGTLELTAQLQQLGTLVCQALGANEWTAMLYDSHLKRLVVDAAAGHAADSMRGVQFALGEGIAGLVAQQAKSIYVEDVEEDPRYLHYKGRHPGTGSFLGVPLRAKGRVLGVMTLSRPAKAAFNQHEIRLAEAIAAQASLAIANARLYQETLELSYTDPLTGIANRRQLYARLEQELSRSMRFGDEVSVLMIDLDLFKAVNDGHGHTVGDSVLRNVALLLKRNVRKVDMVARYGGDEFMVVLPRIRLEEAVDVAEKLRRTVAAAAFPAGPGAAPIRLTVSLGVASFGHDAVDVAGVLEKSDFALYEAKRSGRDRIAVHSLAGRGAA
ncbi:MAG: diguanylate cyclase [Myxococcales bacterium]